MKLEQYRSLTPREQQRWIWEEMQRRAEGCTMTSKQNIDELCAAARAMEQALTTYIRTGFTGLAFHALNNEAKRVRVALDKLGAPEAQP